MNEIDKMIEEIMNTEEVLTINGTPYLAYKEEELKEKLKALVDAVRKGDNLIDKEKIKSIDVEEKKKEFFEIVDKAYEEEYEAEEKVKEYADNVAEPRYKFPATDEVAKQIIWQWIEQLVREEKNRLKGIPNLEEWIKVFRILKIIADEKLDLSTNRDYSDYEIEKLTDEIHLKLRRLINELELNQ